MGDYASLTLVDGETQRVDGIPVGAECTVTEQGEVGEFGETSRSPGSVAVDITETTTPEDEVPTAQLAQLGNDYEFSGLSLTKHVDTEATDGELGPFEFTLSCTTALGDAVTFGDATEVTFTLADGETYDAPADTVPAGATCLVTEQDALQDEIVIVGTDVTDHGDGSATVEVGTSTAIVDVTNGYDAGVLTVTKEADGAGAELYGAGPFGFTAVCTYDGQTLLTEEFVLDAGSTRSFGTYPAGTECVVTETATGGANESVLAPADGTVTIVGPADEEETVGTVGVTATNTFLLGELSLEKIVAGPGAELYGAGPFTAQAVCTWQRDGETVAVDLPNDGLVTLSAANEYGATIGDLLVGTECVVTEVADGGASGASISPEGGVVSIGEEPALVTLTNTFEVTSLEVTKQIDGDADADLTFAVTLVCTWDAGGEQRDVPIPGGAVRELQAPDALTAVYEDLPLGADCTLTETQTGSADATTITVRNADGEQSTEGTSAELTVAAESATSVVVTNVFDPVDPDPSDPADPDPSDPVDPADPEEPGDPGAEAGDDLPGTGSDALPLVAGAVLLLLIGGLILLVVRRRHHT